MRLNIQLQDCRQFSVPPLSFRHVVGRNSEHQQLQHQREDQQHQSVRQGAVSKHQGRHLDESAQNTVINGTLPVLRRLRVLGKNHAQNTSHLKHVVPKQSKGDQAVQKRSALRTLQRQPSQRRQPGRQPVTNDKRQHHSGLGCAVQSNPGTERTTVPLLALQHQVSEKQIKHPTQLQTPGIHQQTGHNRHERCVMQQTETHLQYQQSINTWVLPCKMGTTPSIQGRCKRNEKYQTIYDKLQGNVMARFKHEAYAYALERTHTDYKTIYMYRGYFRIAKADTPLGTNYFELTFASKEDAEEWDNASEQIENVHVEIPWLYRDFSIKWKPIACDDMCKRIYSKLK